MPGGTQQLLSPTTLGSQAVASSFLQALGEVLPCRKSQGKPPSDQLACSDPFPYSPLDDLDFPLGPILLFLKDLLATQDGNRVPHLKTLHRAQLNHTILCDSEF